MQFADPHEVVWLVQLVLLATFCFTLKLEQGTGMGTAVQATQFT